MTEYAPGTPVWADLSTPDLDAATTFYTGLFGWTARAVPDRGGYTFFELDGVPVAAAQPAQEPAEANTWATYFLTADADETARRVTAAGGTIETAPVDVPTTHPRPAVQGRTAAFVDPAGAEFSVWQAGELRGAGVFNVPGAMVWNQLYTPDPDGAKAFYGAVFGWTWQDNPTLTTWQVDGQTVGAMMAETELPAALPAHWMVYFAVEDCAASAEKAASLGAMVSVKPTRIEWGTFAVLNDPTGAFFAIFQG